MEDAIFRYGAGLDGARKDIRPLDACVFGWQPYKKLIDCGYLVLPGSP